MKTLKTNKRYVDLTGSVFNRWTVIKRALNRHRRTMWLCKCTCGTIREVYGRSLLSKKSQSCGCIRSEYNATCIGPRSTSWKGGIKKHEGYILIYRPKYPNADKQGYVLEHVFVMAEHIGRAIDRGETIHHKNGIKDDNRLENLELWTSRHPKGQKVSDLIVFAKEILLKYEPTALNCIKDE